MTLDLYHKVLAKLYEVTEGKESQIVDLKDLVKTQGFLGSYHDIFQFLSIQGWIMETSKADYVKITHWGVKEAKKMQSGLPDASLEVKREAEKLIKYIKEFLITAEEFAAETSKENFKFLENNLDEIKSVMSKLKDNI